MECKLLVFPPPTCMQFHALFLKKYDPQTLSNRNKDEFIFIFGEHSLDVTGVVVLFKDKY